MYKYVNELRETLITEDAFVRGLIDKIPPKFYFDKEVYQKLVSANFATIDKLSKAPKSVSMKTKQRIAKLDPGLYKTVTEIQKMELDSDDEDENTVPTLKRSKSNSLPPHLDELRERLRKKIEVLQAERAGSTAKAKKKKAMKDKLRELKRRERELINRQVNKNKNVQKGKNEPVKSDEKKSSAPVFNKEGKVLYSKFDFADIGMTKLAKGEYSGKNYKKLLSKVEKENKKLAEIEEKDPEGAKRLKEKKKWKVVLEKAEGIKVKNDPELLKKSLKKKEKQKNRSAKKWDTRVKQTEEKMKRRQEKRKTNLKARAKAKRDKKLERLRKKGRLIPGV